MSLPTNFFIGRGNSGPTLTFDVPNGVFLHRNDNNVIFFDVDTETSQTLGPPEEGRFNFDPITGHAYVEDSANMQRSIYSGGSWSSFNQGDMYFGFPENNGRSGGYFNNKAYVVADNNRDIRSLVDGSVLNSGQIPAAAGGIEDGMVFGDVLYIGAYGTVAMYQLFEDSNSFVTLDPPASNDWGTAGYDARTNIKYVQPQNTSAISYYRNNNCLGNLSYGNSSSYSRFAESLSMSSTQYSATLVGFDETTGAINRDGYFYVAHAASGNGITRKNFATGAEVYLGGLGEAVKITPVYSHVQDAYFMFFEDGYIKVPHLGNGQLGENSASGYGYSVAGWRGAGTTTGQKSVSLVSRTKI